MARIARPLRTVYVLHAFAFWEMVSILINWFAVQSMGGLQAKGESSFLMVGLDGAGKTAILNAMSGGDSMETKPTEGHTVRSITLDGHRIKIRDVSGARAMRSYWPRYYEKADALVSGGGGLDTRRCVWGAWNGAWV